MRSLLRFKYKSVTRDAKLATQQAVAQTASQSRSEEQENSNIFSGVIWATACLPSTNENTPLTTRRLPWEIVITITAGLAAVMVIIYLAYLNQGQFKERVVSLTQQQLLCTAKTTALRLEECITEHLEVLKVLAMNPSLQDEAYKKVIHDKANAGFCLIKNVYEIHKEHVDALTVLDADGIMLHRHPFIEDRPGTDHTDKPGVAYVVREHNPYISEVFCNNLGNHAISMSEPIFYKGRFAGILRWIIETDTISKRFIEPIKVGQKGHAWMFENRNIVLSHPRIDFVGMSVLDVIRKMHEERGEFLNESEVEEYIREEHDYLNRVKTEEEGYGIFVNCVTDENDIVAYKRVSIGKTTLNLIMTLPYPEIAGPIRAHARSTFGLAGLVIMLFGAGGLVLFRAEKRRTELKAEGKHLKQIAQSAEALQESEQKLAGIIASVTDHMSMLDEQYNIVWANYVAKALFGPGLVGKKCYSAYYGHDKPCASCVVRKCFEDGNVHEHETEVIGANGNRIMFWRIASMAACDKSGRPKLVIEVSRDITERKKAEEALARQAEALARSNADLEQFAYVASHDLQEPLRMVSSYLKLLERRYKGKLDSKAHEFIHYAVDGADRMSELISDLLKYSRVETRGKDFEQTDCETILDRTLHDMRFAIEDSRAKITHDPLPSLVLDDIQLGQLFQNLIGNAIKFCGDHPPHVHVSATKSKMKKGWVFSVSDNGIGIDPEHAERIFQVFQRLQTRARYRGTGVGLAICKKIVERHGGKIWVESQQGKGSTFYFTIPEHDGLRMAQ